MTRSQAAAKEISVGAAAVVGSDIKKLDFHIKRIKNDTEVKILSHVNQAHTPMLTPN